MQPNLLNKYNEEVVPKLKEALGTTNVHQVPRLEKVVLNSGFGNVDDRKQAAEDVVNDMTIITGQHPVLTKAKNSISNFKLRAGDVIGARVTLRGRIMWEFLDRLLNVAMPTIRDFRGVPTKSFDGNGNYTLGVNDQTIFPEIELDKIKRAVGFDITIVTTANTDEGARVLLSELGMPFRKPGSTS